MADEPLDNLVVNNTLGIGTTEPAAQLHVAATEGISSKVFLESINGSLLKVTAEPNSASIGTENAFPLSINTNGLPRIQISSEGNVGVGTPPASDALLAVNGTVKATAFQGDGSQLTGKVNTSGDTMTGPLTIQSNLSVSGNIGIGTDKPTAKLDVAGNITTTGIISGASLPPNLIRNSYMNILDSTKPAGYSVRGNVTLEAVHPFTKGFEGPYTDKKPENAASNVDTATQTNPYWFGVYYKGQRASRGGLADGWSGLPDGKILKITGNSSGGHTIVYFPFEQNVLTNRVHFKAWLKIASGTKVGFGQDSGWQNIAAGIIITKAQTDAATDGWYQIDALIDISKVTYLGSWNAFAMGIEASGTFEVYLALPYLAILDNDTWLPSVSDMLSRDGLTVHPSSGNVGIGTTSPGTKLEVYGGRLRVSTSDGNSAGVIELSNSSKTNYIFTDGSTGDLFLRTDSPNHDLILQAGGSQGKVGIGTGDPKAKLEVAGDLRADAIHSLGGFKFPDGTIQTTAIRIASGRVGFDKQSGVITNRRTVQLSGFNLNPAVLVALATIDADRNANLRIHTFVDNLTKDSFDICLSSWADTTIWSAQVMWIAFGS